jgi:hypothetical protein
MKYTIKEIESEDEFLEFFGPDQGWVLSPVNRVSSNAGLRIPAPIKSTKGRKQEEKLS